MQKKKIKHMVVRDIQAKDIYSICKEYPESKGYFFEDEYYYDSREIHLMIMREETSKQFHRRVENLYKKYVDQEQRKIKREVNKMIQKLILPGEEITKRVEKLNAKRTIKEKIEFLKEEGHV